MKRKIIDSITVRMPKRFGRVGHRMRLVEITRASGGDVILVYKGARYVNERTRSGPEARRS